MYREPHADRDAMKVWLSESEVEQFISGVEDTDRRIAFGLAFRSGLRVGEIVGVAPEHADRGPQGPMLRIPEENAKFGKYRETPLPPDLATTIRTVDDAWRDLPAHDARRTWATRLVRPTGASVPERKRVRIGGDSPAPLTNQQHP